MLTKQNTAAVIIAAISLTTVVFAQDPYVHPLQPTKPVNGQVRVNNSDPDRVIFPEADWLLCEGQNPLTTATGIDCSVFSAGHEKYLFMIKAKNQSTTGYVFSVTFKRKLDGFTIRITGIVQRNDNPDGYTVVELDPGAPVASWTTNTEELKNQ